MKFKYILYFLKVCYMSYCEKFIHAYAFLQSVTTRSSCETPAFSNHLVCLNSAPFRHRWHSSNQQLMHQVHTQHFPFTIICLYVLGCMSQFERNKLSWRQMHCSSMLIENAHCYSNSIWVLEVSTIVYLENWHVNNLTTVDPSARLAAITSNRRLL